MNDCIFCKIIDKEIEASVIYEDDIVIVIMDIQPINPGHVLIIPKKCEQLIINLDDEIVSYMFKIAKKINKSIRNSNVKCEGVNYFLADGEAAMQEIFHSHLHVFPRYKNDGFGLKFSNSYTNLPERKELDLIASEIKTCLNKVI